MGVSVAADRIEVTGDLTAESVPALYRATPAFDLPRYTVALGGIGRCDSSGLALLVYWAVRAARTSAQLSFQGVPATLGELARLGGLAGLFDANGAVLQSADRPPPA